MRQLQSFRRNNSGSLAKFVATAVTDGPMLDGVKFREGTVDTQTVVMRSVTGTVRWIRAEHRRLDMF